MKRTPISPNPERTKARKAKKIQRAKDERERCKQLGVVKSRKPVSDATLESYFNKIIRARDKTCRICVTLGTEPTLPLDVHHVSGRVGRLEWDTSCAILLCRCCHSLIHDRPNTGAAMLNRTLGRSEYERMMWQKRNPTGEWIDTHSESKKLRDELKQLLKSTI